MQRDTRADGAHFNRAVEHARLTGMGMRLLPVPRGPSGPDLDVMRRLVDAHAPRLYVTVSVLHNPTGAMLSLAAAHQVLRLAEDATLDLAHLSQDRFRQPRQMRSDPWL